MKLLILDLTLDSPSAFPTASPQSTDFGHSEIDTVLPGRGLSHLAFFALEIKTSIFFSTATSHMGVRWVCKKK
jgi:hypothetical protein